MKNKLLAMVLAIPFICLLGWVGILSYQCVSGQEIKVSVMGYDPRDLLSGHYIQYQIDWDKTDCGQFEGAKCPIDEFCRQARWGRQCRFYVPEKNARQLNRLFAGRNDTDMVFEVMYSYSKGKEPIAKQLLINGQDWRDFIKNR